MTELQLLKKLQIGICYINSCFEETYKCNANPKNNLCKNHWLAWGIGEQDEFIRRKNSA